MSNAKTRLGLLAAASLMLVVPAHAQESEVWKMTSSQGTCRLSFEEDPVAEGVLSTLFHDDGCFKFKNPVTGYSMNNGENTIILYSTHDGLKVVGRADMEEPGHYVGVIDDTDELTLIQE